MNSSVIVREATPNELRNWDGLVERFENCRIFHKTSWLRSIEAYSGAKLLRLVFEREGNIVAGLPGFLTRVSLVRIFASPMIGWQTAAMGPVFDSDLISTHEMFSTLLPYLAKRYAVHHIELANGHLDPKAMVSFDFRGVPLFTYRVTLYPDDEERTLRNLKSKTRNQLRKAVKLGLITEINQDESFVDEYHDQLIEVFTRRGSVVPFNRDRVLQLFRHMRDSNNLLAISVRKPDDGVCIATGLFLIDGRDLYLWGWTHRTQYRWYCPTELLTWTAMQKGMEAGCNTFDMAGGGDAKVKFGAVPDRTVWRWMWSRYRWLAKLRDEAERVYRWQQSLRGQIARRRVFGRHELSPRT